jgi:CRISPR-associated exonuclease Cas4
MTCYAESDLLPLSALQHLVFCERQCALIHIEQLWAENRLTAEGRQLHERVHEQESESRGDVRIVRGLRIRSLRLGLIGVADVVEFHHQPDGAEQPFPVEYKRGRPKPGRCDEVQLCAQAMCIEEMLATPISTGAIFYGQPRRRLEVSLCTGLRDETEALAARLHLLQQSGHTPPPVYEKKCDQCSLLALCLPKAACKRASAYLHRAVSRALEPPEPAL